MILIFLLLLLVNLIKAGCKDYLNDPGFQSAEWRLSPRTFLTYVIPANIPIQIPNDGFILLAQSSLSAPTFRASIDIEIPAGLTELFVITNFTSSSGNNFKFSQQLESNQWTIPNEAMIASQNTKDYSYNWTASIGVEQTELSFSLRINSAPEESQWLAITSVEIYGCPPSSDWWKGLLIVCGVLAGLFLIAFLIYKGIGMPGSRKRNNKGPAYISFDERLTV